MRRHPPLRAAWLALLMFVLATLTPTMSRAMAHVQGQTAPWATLCSAADGSGLPLGGPFEALKHLGDHCPACHLQSSDLAPPPAAAAGLPRLGATAGQPSTAVPAHLAAHRWSSGQARAPPAGH